MKERKRKHQAARLTAATRNKRQERAPADAKIVEVEIERIVPGGAGLAHADGQTIFVALAAPGDVVRARIERVQGRAAFASIVDIVRASPQRIEPPCPYFGRCGGCDFQQLNYDAQLASKVDIVRDCLRRIARLDVLPEITISASPRAWRYRSRAQWQYDGRAGHLGYFERGSHKVCDVVECPVVVPELQAALSELRERVRNKALPQDAGEFQAVAGDEAVTMRPHVGEFVTDEASRTINKWRYRFSADGFFQINHELLPALVAAAIAEARGEQAVDLYCGVGLFTLPLAQRFARVIGVETSDAAVQYARRNVAEAGAVNAQIECAKVGEWLQREARRLAPIDLVLLDPPRAGMADEGALEGLVALRPQRIAYVSCDPATLARDLRLLIKSGYQLESVRAFDMFPQTHHVETVAHLSC